MIVGDAMDRLSRFLSACALAGICLVGSGVAAFADSGIGALLVLVGGNSECRRDGGIWLMRDRLTRDIKKALGDQVQVERRYYSWTGDREDHTGCLPEHRDWLDGSKHIRTDWPELLRAAPGRKIVIIGWSNGGATAYELACSLSKSAPERVSLLVTLDPVSRLTEPTDYCRRQDGTPNGLGSPQPRGSCGLPVSAP